MKYAVEMGQVAMIYIPSLIEWFIHSKIDIGDIYTHRYTESMVIS
jgi:hypothetical protein